MGTFCFELETEVEGVASVLSFVLDKSIGMDEFGLENTTNEDEWERKEVGSKETMTGLRPLFLSYAQPSGNFSNFRSIFVISTKSIFNLSSLRRAEEIDGLRYQVVLLHDVKAHGCLPGSIPLDVSGVKRHKLISKILRAYCKGAGLDSDLQVPLLQLGRCNCSNGTQSTPLFDSDATVETVGLEEGDYVFVRRTMEEERNEPGE